MARQRNRVPPATAAADRTVGQLVDWFAQSPPPDGLSADTARYLGGAWRRLVRNARPDDWDRVRLGDVDAADLLSRYALTTRSENTLGSMRTRLPKALGLYEDAVRSGTATAGDSIPSGRGDVVVAAGPDAPGGAAGTGRRRAGVEPDVSREQEPDRTTGQADDDDDDVELFTVNLAAGRRWTFRIPPGCTAADLDRIKAYVQASSLP